MVVSSKIKIGTRASKLAVCQAMEVKNAILSQHCLYSPEQIEIIKITTSGDKLLDQKISAIGNKGLFTKEIEEALLNNTIDIAVHSMKDLPAVLPEGLAIKAVLQRADARDAFISKKYNTLLDLPLGSTVATSSIRRKAMLLNYRKDLNIIDIRGNIITRLEKLNILDIDAIILATAGLQRLKKISDITEIIPTDIMLPAVGQGALGIECRIDNHDVIKILNNINHGNTELCVNAERSYMLSIGGDCNTPIGCYAYINNCDINIKAQLLHPLGKQDFAIERSGKATEIGNIIKEMSQITKNKAGDIINFIKC